MSRDLYNTWLIVFIFDVFIACKFAHVSLKRITSRVLVFSLPQGIERLLLKQSWLLGTSDGSFVRIVPRADPKHVFIIKKDLSEPIHPHAASILSLVVLLRRFAEVPRIKRVRALLY